MRLTSCMLAGLVVLAGGCSTVRYASRVHDDGYSRKIGQFRNRYEIRKLTFKAGGETFFRQIGMGNGNEAKAFASAEVERSSANSSQPLPISVVVTPVRESFEDNLLTFLNGLTFGAFPYSRERNATVKVTVSSMDERRSFDRREFTIEYTHKSRFTPFFGIWPFLPEWDDCLYRTEYAGPDWNARLANEVYFRAIGQGVAKVLSRIDDNLAMQGETKDGEDSARRMQDASLPKETLEEKAKRRNERMKVSKCPVCGSERGSDGKCPLCN